jgi:hypothetical protein
VALLWMALFYPQKIFVVYSAYLFLSLATWIKLDRKDPLWVVFVFPFYRAAETVCRLIAHFYWFKIKFHYIFKEKFQRYVSARHIVTEYAIVTIFITTLWLASGYQAESRVNNLQNSVIRHNAPVQAVNISLSKVEPLVAQYAPSITAAQPNTNQASAQL